MAPETKAMEDKAPQSDITATPATQLRPLTESELQRLETALGKPIERNYLRHWVSEATRDVVKVSLLPSPPQLRQDVRRMARDGRHWFRELAKYSNLFSPAQHGAVHRMEHAAIPFLASLDDWAAEAAAASKRGRPRTNFAMTQFLKKMIGIAKKAKVLPSTPTRAISTKKQSPPFFQFVLEALATARNVVRSSELPTPAKAAALSALRTQSNEALIKSLEKLRGRISDYEERPQGLIRRQNSKPATPRSRRQSSP